jgi:hypothetical protein
MILLDNYRVLCDIEYSISDRRKCQDTWNYWVECRIEYPPPCPGQWQMKSLTDHIDLTGPCLQISLGRNVRVGRAGSGASFQHERKRRLI